MVSHLDSLWNRGTREYGNDLFSKCKLQRGLYLEGQFCVTALGAYIWGLYMEGLIHEGAYFRNLRYSGNINTNKRIPSMWTLESEGQTHGLPAGETKPNYICQFEFKTRSVKSELSNSYQVPDNNF